MSSLAPLLTPLSKKQRGKAKKYIAIDQNISGSSPYKPLAKVQIRKKKAKKNTDSGDHPRVVNPKLGYLFEEALRRRDFRQALWMITNDEIPANYETRTGETALLAAVSAKNLDALAMLMTSVTNTGLYDNDIVASVLDYNPKLILTDQSGRTAFDWAKLTGNTQALEWLENRQREKSLKHQSLANRQDRVAQCQALLSYHEECIQRIESLIALQFFDENGLVEFLKATTISVSEFTRAFNDLKAMDNTPRALPFRSQFFVNIETREGWTPLTKCAAFGYAFGVQELVSMGADYRYETRLRHTAMTWASYCGHEAVVLHLLRVGVDVNQKTRDGKTALMHAISNSQAKIVHHLLIATRDECFPVKPIESFSTEATPTMLHQSKIKARISEHKTKELKPKEIEWHKTFLKTMKWQDRTGKDVLKLAQDAVEQTEAMYTELPDVYSSDQEEELPPAVHVLWQVQIALKDAEDHRKYVELHAERTKLTTCHNDNCSFVAPKDMLPTHEQHHCMKRTIKIPCPNKCQDKQTGEVLQLSRELMMAHVLQDSGDCPLRETHCPLDLCGKHDLDLATYFLQNVDAFNVVNEEFANGFSPLVLAASLGNIDLIQLLFRFGADVNLETSRGRTPLSEACMAQDVDIVKLLIENRACVSHTNKQGRNLLEMVHAFADSETSADKISKWDEIIHLLEDQVELERAQRDLFIAISCSNYDHLVEHFKYSAKTRSHTHFVNPLETLQELVTAKEKQANTVRAELDEAIQVFNESIAETEAKRVQAIQLSSQVDDSCRRLQNVEKDEEASDIDSSALEADMLAMIRQITAQDIAQLLNSHVPSDTSLVVVKALSLLCGVVPRGRRNATEYTDVEWWKTAQALLMDRSLLRQLRGYRQQTISPEVMAKVRRECLKTPAFAACSAEFKANRASFKTESGERSLNSRIPPIETLRGNIIGMLATWVQGVELEYKTRAERQALVERKRQLEVALTMARERQQHSRFEAQVGVRSLPARQEEVEAVRTQHDVARKEVEAAKKRLDTYKLLNYAALSGHTPLTFACAVGNEAIIHMLLSHGACSGHQFEEQNLCASFIQALVRDFQYRKKFERQRRLQELSRGGTNSRSDAATEALVRNVAHSFIVGHYQRKLVHFRQTHRVAIHEAIINGNPEIAAILLSKGAKLWQKTYVLPERVYPGSLLESVAPYRRRR
ncbi:hypothetical protein PInf_025894 [Phytophthora infestans]|nr:hypothetical protein PInf_025894 [Phytophthora infestans]